MLKSTPDGLTADTAIISKKTVEELVESAGSKARRLFLSPNGFYREHSLTLKGKYHCIADLLFDWLEFSFTLQVWSNPNQSNRRSAVE